MIKKFSIFFSPGVRCQFDSDLEFRASPGLKVAMEFPGKLLGLLIDRDDLRPLREAEREAKLLYGGAWKVFLADEMFNEAVVKALRQAYRMESVLRRYATPSGTWYLHLEVKLYKRGNTNRLMEISPAILERDGFIEVCGLGYTPSEL